MNRLSTENPAKGTSETYPETSHSHHFHLPSSDLTATINSHQAYFSSLLFSHSCSNVKYSPHSIQGGPLEI